MFTLIIGLTRIPFRSAGLMCSAVLQNLLG